MERKLIFILIKKLILLQIDNFINYDQAQSVTCRLLIGSFTEPNCDLKKRTKSLLYFTSVKKYSK
jgi:hypothetical protein